MSRIERAIVLWALGYMAVYAPLFIGCTFLLDRDVAAFLRLTPDVVFPWIMPFHFLGMVQNLIALVLTIRDVYRRPFPHPNDKVTWILLIVCTGGIGWIVYVFKHALKPRPTPKSMPQEPDRQTSGVDVDSSAG